MKIPQVFTLIRFYIDPIKPGWHMNKKYWISAYFNQDVPDEKIRELVQKSYDIVVKGLPKKVREEIVSAAKE